MLLAPRAMFVVALTLALASGAFAQCTKDTDCKGDRVCVNGTCTDPSAKPAASVLPDAGQAPSLIAPCKVEAPDEPSMVMRAGGELLPMTYLAASVDTKTGGLVGSAFSYGISKVKSKTLLRIDKPRAALRIHDRQPQFLDLLTPVGSSPDNQYFLVRLTTKDNARFVQVGSSEANAAGSSASALLFPDGVRIEVTAETLSRSCTYEGKKYAHHRIKPASPLKNGEYGLLVSQNRLFDFGVDDPQ